MPAGLPNPTNNALVAVVEAHATDDVSTTPVLAGYNNARFLSRLHVDINRDANVGGGTVKGAKLPNFAPIPDGRDPDNTSRGVIISGSDDAIAAATGRSNFTVDIPFVTISGNNWVCMFYDASAGTLACLDLATAATTGAGEFFVETADAGASTKLTIGASVAGGEVEDNDEIRLFYIDPLDIQELATYANGTLAPNIQEADGVDIAWLETDDTQSPSATNVYLKPLIVSDG